MSLHPSIPVLKMVANRNDAGSAPGSQRVEVDVALCWTNNYFGENIIGFANGIRTNDGGTHVDGLRNAITRTVNKYCKKSGKLKEGSASISGEHIREGLTAVVSVKVPEPEFEGQTKGRLGNLEVKAIVDATVKKQFGDLLDRNDEIATEIVRKSLQARAAAQAAKNAREMVRTKASTVARTILPGKLADCSSNDPSQSEIFIVEGDSAAGSAKQGRDRSIQAILPLRGKVLNIEKTTDASKIHKNAELQALIVALGLDFGLTESAYNLEKLRYHRIVLMTDADVDGSHIRLLLLTFLYRYQKELFEHGHIYIACPPLVKISGGKGKLKEDLYFYTEEELNEYLSKIPPNEYPEMQRFKGLGEMIPKQLWETTMDPAKRRMKKVNVANAKSCDELLTSLMGRSAASRRSFILQNSEDTSASNLDV